MYGGGVPFPLLAPDGSAAAPSYAFASNPNTGIWLSANVLEFNVAGAVRFYVQSSSVSINSDTIPLTWGGGQDVQIVKDGAADTLALKRTTNAQTFRVYGTTTGPQYGEVKSTGSNQFILNSVGTSPSVLLQSGGTTQLQVRANDVNFTTTASPSYSATSPAQITANQNDYNPGTGGYFRLDLDAARSITGFAGPIDGRVIIISNVSAFTLTIQNQNAGSSANNRVITGTGADLAVLTNQTVKLIYDATTLRWRVFKNA